MTVSGVQWKDEWILRQMNRINTPNKLESVSRRPHTKIVCGLITCLLICMLAPCAYASNERITPIEAARNLRLPLYNGGRLGTVFDRSDLFASRSWWCCEAISAGSMVEFTGVLKNEMFAGAGLGKEFSERFLPNLKEACFKARLLVRRDGRVDIHTLGIDIAMRDGRLRYSPFPSGTYDEILRDIYEGRTGLLLQGGGLVVASMGHIDSGVSFKKGNRAPLVGWLKRSILIVFSFLILGCLIMVGWHLLHLVLRKRHCETEQGTTPSSSGALPTEHFRLNRRSVVGFALFVSLYVAVLIWFGNVDVYRNYFFQRGYVYILYNLFRVLYLGYLTWILYYLGRILLKALVHRGIGLNLGLLGEFILCFLIGASVSRIFLYLLGYLNLYYYALAVSLTVVAVIASYSEFLVFLRRLGGGIESGYESTSGFVGKYLACVLFGIVCFSFTFLLIAKGLYPGGYGDYYNHYFPFFKAVIESHGIWPNDVWYQYYYSKGAGLTFLSILLTDYESPQVVSYCFVGVSALAAWSVIHKISKSALWSMTGVVAYLIAIVYTPAGVEAAKQLAFLDQRVLLNESIVQFLMGWEWGHFQKQHVQTMACIGLFLWMIITFRESSLSERRTWVGLIALVLVGIILFAPTSFVILVPFLALMCLIALTGKVAGEAKAFAVIGIIGVATLGFVFGINYATTGMFEITPVRFFWKLADQERLSRWVSPYLMLSLLEGSRQSLGELKFPALGGMDIFMWLNGLFRLYILRYFFFVKYGYPILACIVLGLLLHGKRPGSRTCRHALPVIALAVVAVGVGMIVDQPISLFRSYAFCVFVTVILCVFSWLVLAEIITNGRLRGIVLFVVPVVIAFWCVICTVSVYPVGEMKNRVAFLSGRLSIGGVYATQNALWPDAVKVRELVGSDRRVWNFNSHLVCMAPDFVLETAISFGLGGWWHEIMFTTPERAKELLRKQRVNYFIINTKEPLNDYFVHSPLFRPKNVGHHLEVLWRSDENTYLLTWPGENTVPISATFLEEYRRNLEQPLGWDREGIYNRLRDVYESNKGKPYPLDVTPNSAPLRGFQ